VSNPAKERGSNMSEQFNEIVNPLDGRRAGWDRAEYGDGQFETGFFGDGQNAWHGLGTVIPEDVVTAEQALELAGLDWEVERVPLFTVAMSETGVGYQQLDSHFANVRSTDRSVLGVVGKGYKLVQNREGFAFLNDLVDDSGAKFHTAGSLSNGKRVWILARLPENLKVTGWEEEVAPFLLFTNTHDGSGSLTMAATPIRVVCRNTVDLAIKGSQHVWRMRHSSGITGRVNDAREALGLAFTYYEAFEQEAARLATTKVKFDSFLENLVPFKPNMEPDSRAARNIEETRSAIRAIYAQSDNLQNLQGTAWGAYNAVAEYADHDRPIRGENNLAERKWSRAMFDGTGLKAKAYALVSA